MTTTHTLLLSLALLSGPTLAGAAPAPLPGAAASAEQIAALPGGVWLVQEKKRLRLIGLANTELARLDLRSEGLDLRREGDSFVALVLDQNAQRAQPLRIDPQRGLIEPMPAPPAPDFGIETQCLYRDAQGLLQAFLIGKDGRAEQWLLAGSTPRKLRSLALPPEPAACQADDARGQLLVAEEALGLWAYPADAEAAPAREPVLLGAPFGRLKSGIRALAPVAGGVAALDAEGRLLHPLHFDGTRWQAHTALPLARKAEALALDLSGGASRTVLARSAQGWHPRRVSLPAPVPARALPVVLPQGQTEPVARQGDAADDPAIWVHPAQPTLSRVLGTNKKQGLLVYDLAGRELQSLAVGRINNVDLRQGVQLGGHKLDLAVATQRDERTLVVFEIDADGTVSERAQVPTGLDDIYGVCVFAPAGGGLDALVNDKDGRFRQIRLGLENERLTGRVVREFKVASQPEGCVVDEASGLLFLGEEDRGIWVLAADAQAPATPRLIAPVGPMLRADVEGLAIHHGGRTPWLVASSQGNNSYVVIEARPPYRIRGAFRIGINVAAGIDGASDTDGLDVTHVALGPAYPQGLLVVQDGRKRLPDGPQNFKYVSWADVARALKLED